MAKGLSAANTRRPPRRDRRGLPRRAAPWLLWGLGVAVIAAGLVLLDHRWQAQNAVDVSDPAVRVAGAVRSISGPDSVRRTEYDQASKSAQVEAASKYYDASKPLNENRQYLETEGRMAAQLALYGNPEVGAVTIRLFARRALLATVVARQGQKYEEMKVEYSGPLVPPQGR
jgi:hypothetical protein